MRNINTIIIHCSATPGGRHFTEADIDRWHRQRGFDSIGYHYVILLDGTIRSGRPEATIGAHCRGHNANSIGICYIGGLDPASGQPADTRTPQQKQALITLLQSLRLKYPQARIMPHSAFAAKACPCFDAATEYATI